MKNVNKIKKNANSACSVVSLQSDRTQAVPEAVRDCDLIIDLRSDMDSCDNNDDNEIIDIDKKCSPNEYTFEGDIEKLIKVSKQFQTDYENEKAKSDAVPIVYSNSLRKQKSAPSEVILPVNDQENFYFSSRSSRKENTFELHLNHSNKLHTPTIPYPGAFGTGIIRPSPKKHSCVRNSETSSSKRSRRFGWSVKPYTSRYYNFDRTHPDLKLVESGVSMIPKRIPKETAAFTGRAKSVTTPKPLLNGGLTWHEFFERSNVYSAKSFQTSCGDTHTTATQATVSELLTPRSNGNMKIQKHILPQMNIRAECCVQRIPEISIAPCGFRRTTNTNIKLVEIIYEESNSKEETSERQRMESLEEGEQKTGEPLQLQSNPEEPESVSLEQQIIDHQSADINETKTSFTCSSTTPSRNDGYDSSLEESISLNVSRASAALTPGFTDHEIKGKSLKDVGIQTLKSTKIAAHKTEDTEERTVALPSDHNRLEYDESCLQPQEVYPEIKLPTFPTNELVQMVDEIFDTSSDAVNMSYKYIVKETSVQTDIVWENINDLFKQQQKLKPPTDAVGTQVTESSLHRDATFVKPLETGGTNIVNESEKFDNRHLVQATGRERSCRHSRLKQTKICSCLTCKSNVRFSVVHIDHAIQRTSNDSSSSPVFDSRPVPSAKFKLLPSERYKRMKQAQREHFENDPRISRTLRKIYATAGTNELRKETTSSSSSDPYRRSNAPPCGFSTLDDEVLEPDLFTSSDEILLFGLRSFDEFQYSSNLLKTESSQDSSVSSGKYAADRRKQPFLGRNLFCTNSEESSCHSVYGQRSSELEQCLLKDIENSGSDPSAVNSLLSTSSLERKMNEIHLGNLSTS